MLDIGALRREFPLRRIDYYPTIDSTMRAAAALELGDVVLADEQTAGLGRHGHSWHSQAGSGIYCSMVLAPAPVLTLALGLAAVEAIAKATGIVCDLRWPNDVMIQDRKVAGILVQLSGGKAIAGIGINVNHAAFPEELAGEATSLALAAGLKGLAGESERMAEREKTLADARGSESQASLCGRLRRRDGKGTEAGLRSPASLESVCPTTIAREPIITALLTSVQEYTAYATPEILRLFTRASSYASGRRVVVQQPDGAICGVTAGLNADGFLVVRREDGTDTLIIAGGVRAARA